MFLGAFISVTAVLFDTGQARRKIGVRILKCLVEMTGVEPVSENKSSRASTGIGNGQNSLRRRSIAKAPQSVAPKS